MLTRKNRAPSQAEIERAETLAARESYAKRVAHTYHGLPFLEEALRVHDGNYSYAGKNVAVIGHSFGRSRIPDVVVKEGGSITLVGMDKVATNAKNPFSNAPLPELAKSGVYDQLGVYLGVGLYEGKRKQKFLREALRSVDYGSGGEAHFLASDFTDTDSAAKGNRTVNGALGAVNKFFETSGMNQYQGASLLAEVQKAIANNPELEAVEIVHDRPAGSVYWPELRDLYNMLAAECADAIEELKGAPLPIRALKSSQFISTRKKLLAQVAVADAMIDLPEAQRPSVQPPRFHSVTVRLRREAPSDIKVFV